MRQWHITLSTENPATTHGVHVAAGTATVLHGWAWVDGEDAEIQWFEAVIPRYVKQSSTRISICARAGNVERRTMRHAPGSTPKAPIWVRTDNSVVVDRW